LTKTDVKSYQEGVLEGDFKDALKDWKDKSVYANKIHVSILN
jgi:hypothetical protein